MMRNSPLPGTECWGGSLEVKAHCDPGERHLRGFRAIAEKGPFRHRVLFSDCDDVPPRINAGIDLLPVSEFLERLWSDAWQT